MRLGTAGKCTQGPAAAAKLPGICAESTEVGAPRCAESGQIAERTDRAYDSASSINALAAAVPLQHEQQQVDKQRHETRGLANLEDQLHPPQQQQQQQENSHPQGKSNQRPRRKQKTALQRRKAKLAQAGLEAQPSMQPASVSTCRASASAAAAVTGAVGSRLPFPFLSGTSNATSQHPDGGNAQAPAKRSTMPLFFLGALPPACLPASPSTPAQSPCADVSGVAPWSPVDVSSASSVTPLAFTGRPDGIASVKKTLTPVRKRTAPPPNATVLPILSPATPASASTSAPNVEGRNRDGSNVESSSVSQGYKGGRSGEANFHYAAVFLTAAAQLKLLNQSPPRHPRVFADHVTLLYKPSREQVPSLFRLPAVGRDLADHGIGADSMNLVCSLSAWWSCSRPKQAFQSANWFQFLDLDFLFITIRVHLLLCNGSYPFCVALIGR